jgi:hypothetical protein
LVRCVLISLLGWELERTTRFCTVFFKLSGDQTHIIAGLVDGIGYLSYRTMTVPKPWRVAARLAKVNTRRMRDGGS